MLRSFRLGEADRVLHLYTLERGRSARSRRAIRKTKSRFGARLEPLSHVELHAPPGRRASCRRSPASSCMRSHRAAREDRYRLGVGLVGAEAMLRLFTEQEANARAFAGADALPRPARRARRRAASGRALDPLALSFQLKLLWLSGYLPHLTSCAECGAAGRAARRLLAAAPAAPSAARARGGGARAVAGRVARRSRRCSRAARGRAAVGLTERARARRARRDHRVVRVPRRLPAADAARLAPRPASSRRPRCPRRRAP